MLKWVYIYNSNSNIGGEAVTEEGGRLKHSYISFLLSLIYAHIQFWSHRASSLGSLSSRCISWKWGSEVIYIHIYIYVVWASQIEREVEAEWLCVCINIIIICICWGGGVTRKLKAIIDLYNCGPAYHIQYIIRYMMVQYVCMYVPFNLTLKHVGSWL